MPLLLLLHARVLAAVGPRDAQRGHPPPWRRRRTFADYSVGHGSSSWNSGREMRAIEGGDPGAETLRSVAFSQREPGKPESMLKMTKKGKILMMFVIPCREAHQEKETEGNHEPLAGQSFQRHYDVRGPRGVRTRYRQCFVMEVRLGEQGLFCRQTGALM
ncbi:LRP chaperone MESD [Camelus dromedarius]|uniref:LRP chaperone MESD n=1 Tax=Camelus dromedarius TaxID=9838 RepID=A0A5N4DIH5_CAMDR|nr:LRP chaperone MESD [Camelus dromedarius]